MGYCPSDERLTHIENVVAMLRADLDRRMDRAGDIMEQITTRAYRQALITLDELRKFQRMSMVTLRNASVPLIKIELHRLGEDEGQDTMRKYL